MDICGWGAVTFSVRCLLGMYTTAHGAHLCIQLARKSSALAIDDNVDAGRKRRIHIQTRLGHTSNAINFDYDYTQHSTSTQTQTRARTKRMHTQRLQLCQLCVRWKYALRENVAFPRVRELHVVVRTVGRGT